MAETTKPKNGPAAAGPAGNPTGNPAGNPTAGPAAPQVRVMGQYIKDLSFENPNVSKLLSGPGDNPNLNIEVNVNATRMGNDVFESAINFKGTAQNAIGIIYDLELVYAGLFKIENVPEAALEQTLLINCPALLFPFLRRLIADISREGGFPPLMLDPIDFAGLYVARKQHLAGQGNAPTSSLKS